MELVNLRLISTVPVEKPELDEPTAEGDAASGRREANFDGEWLEVAVLDRADGRGFGGRRPCDRGVQGVDVRAARLAGGRWTASARWYWRESMKAKRLDPVTLSVLASALWLASPRRWGRS